MNQIPLRYVNGPALDMFSFVRNQQRLQQGIYLKYRGLIQAAFVQTFSWKGKIVMAALLNLPSVISSVNRAPRPAVIQDSSFVTTMEASILEEQAVFTRTRRPTYGLKSSAKANHAARVDAAAK